MFPFHRRRADATSSETGRSNADGDACFVFWPNGERQCFMVDLARFDAAALANARKWLEILSLSGSFVRGSVATGRLQTMTSLVVAPTGRPLAVRITNSNDEPLATVAVFGRHHDPASVTAALTHVADAARVAVTDLQTLAAEADLEGWIALAPFGPKHDAAVDEAYAIALHVGAAMNRANLSRQDQAGKA